MRILKLLLFSSLLVACSEKQDDRCIECNKCGLNLNINEDSLQEAIDRSKNLQSSMSDSIELKESVAKIEEKYGEQWDFCQCVVVNDSIDRAIKLGNTTDKLLDRWDLVDRKCQAFRIQDPNRTPEEREAHERKVNKCLREAGIGR